MTLSADVECGGQVGKRAYARARAELGLVDLAVAVAREHEAIPRSTRGAQILVRVADEHAGARRDAERFRGDLQLQRARLLLRQAVAANQRIEVIANSRDDEQLVRERMALVRDAAELQACARSASS